MNDTQRRAANVRYGGTLARILEEVVELDEGTQAEPDLVGELGGVWSNVQMVAGWLHKSRFGRNHNARVKLEQMAAKIVRVCQILKQEELEDRGFGK